MNRTNINFEKDSVTRYMEQELMVFDKLQESFDYVASKLAHQAPGDLNDIKWDEDKNYDWCVIVDGSATLIIRKYQSHFTIYTRSSIERVLSSHTYVRKRYSSFTFFSEYGDDDTIDNPFIYLNKALPAIIKLVQDDKVSFIWNSHSFDCPKEAKVTLISSGENIHSIDQMIFALDELTQMHLVLFSENEMLEAISKYNVGDQFNSQYNIKDVKTVVKDNYYHAVGLSLVDAKGESKWEDVYSLTRWYYDDVIKTKI